MNFGSLNIHFTRPKTDDYATNMDMVPKLKGKRQKALPFNFFWENT